MTMANITGASSGTSSSRGVRTLRANRRRASTPRAVLDGDDGGSPAAVPVDGDAVGAVVDAVMVDMDPPGRAAGQAAIRAPVRRR